MAFANQPPKQSRNINNHAVEHVQCFPHLGAIFKAIENKTAKATYCHGSD